MSRSLDFYQALKAIFLHIDHHEKDFLAQYNLNVPRFYVLVHLRDHPGITFIELSDLLLCTKSNTTRIVQGMQKDGLVLRQNHPADGRSYCLFLSEKGQILLESIFPVYLSQVKELMERFSPEQIERFLPISQQIENTLVPTSPQGRSAVEASAPAWWACEAGMPKSNKGSKARSFTQVSKEKP